MRPLAGTSPLNVCPRRLLPHVSSLDNGISQPAGEIRGLKKTAASQLCSLLTFNRIVLKKEFYFVFLCYGYQLLSGEDAEITANLLYTEDLDTPPEELVYSIEDLSNGIVALRVSPGDSIENFTQAQINSGEVVFIHKGEPLESITFVLNIVYP